MIDKCVVVTRMDDDRSGRHVLGCGVVCGMRRIENSSINSVKIL